MVKTKTLRWYDEKKDKRKAESSIQKAFIRKANKDGFSFEKAPRVYYCDICDNNLSIFGEVKSGAGIEGISQVLIGMAQGLREKNKDIEKGKYILLVDDVWAYFFDFPEHSSLIEFYDKYNKAGLSPSKFSANFSTEKEAAKILGDAHIKVWRNETLYTDAKHLNVKGFMLNEHNLPRFLGLLVKYKIHGPRFIDMLVSGDIGKHDDELVCIKNGVVIRRMGFNGEMTPIDIFILTHTKITTRAEFDRCLDKMGVSSETAIENASYYTLGGKQISDMVAEIVKPTFVIEPYAGSGVLIDAFYRANGWGFLNDFDEKAVNALKLFYRGRDFEVYNRDFIEWPTKDIVKRIPKGQDLLIITNPPFNSKWNKEGVAISYGGLEKRYGKGSQLFPAIGKTIEVIKSYGSGCLAFFSPMGLFCERTTYMKLLSLLLKDFEYVQGYIYSGSMFQVSKDKPIAFTIWKYKFNCNTVLEKLQFNLTNDNVIGFQRNLLLKDGWKYSSSNYTGEIAVTRNERFNTAQAKIFRDRLGDASELTPINVKIDLQIPNIPSELIYGLWSSVVGTRTIIKHPLYIDNAYVHIPDFKQEKVMEILAYTLLYAFVVKDYTDGLIVIKPRKVKFGISKRLNDGANYLFKTYRKLPVGHMTVSRIIKDLRKGIVHKGIQNLIKDEISKRLDEIGYWDFIPLPLKEEIDEVGTLKNWLSTAEAIGKE